MLGHTGSRRRSTVDPPEPEDGPFGESDAPDVASRRLLAMPLPTRPDRTAAIRPANPANDPADDPAARSGTSPAGQDVLGALNPGRRGTRAIAVLAVAVVATAALLAWRALPRTEPVEAAVAAPSTTAGSTPVGEIVVAVAGLVQRPGLVRLPEGSRVADAIDAAGGLLAEADIGYLNLARRLVDGELLLVGVTPSTQVAGVWSATPDGTAAAAGPVNLNTAGVAELQSLPGIGPVLAQRIVDHRDEHGPFATVAELQQVEGIGSATYDDLRDLVTV